MLKRMIGFVNTADADKARGFYSEVLGFRLMGDDQFALVFDANGTMLRVAKGAKSPPAPHTVLGWEVEDIVASARELTARGAHFEQWNLPFMKQDELGIWDAPGGDRVAWFKDPDGNVLSISQHVTVPRRS